ncbi:hypothetical protein CSKR_101020 [Clonorchis sinensis]|uniref:Uncharacterized protein n=1 Tax=Clonorchis sinensis TaxID=79923 RepID=A0A3R7GLW9_CLOSI|nr:hypothetical protein CSKR_101020 [Clonorchis sinensis]
MTLEEVALSRSHWRSCIKAIAFSLRFVLPNNSVPGASTVEGDEMTQWLEREFTDRKVFGSNPTFASRLLLPRLGQPGSIVLPRASFGRVPTPPLHLDFPCLGFGNRAVPCPSCLLRVAWQLCTERVLELALGPFLVHSYSCLYNKAFK